MTGLGVALWENTHCHFSGTQNPATTLTHLVITVFLSP